MMTTRNSPLRINELSRITRTLFRQHHHGVGLFVLIATLFVLSFLAGLQPPMQFRVFMAGEVADSDVVAHRSLTVEDTEAAKIKRNQVAMLQPTVFDLSVTEIAALRQKIFGMLKLINGQGEKMEESVIALVEDYLDDRLQLFGEKWHEIPFTKGGEIGRTVDYSAGRNRYIGYLISLGVYSFKGMRIGLDCANGSAWNIAKAVFDALGAKTYVINAEPDGTNINNNAGSTHIEGLQKLVVEKGLDVGFAYDGDADRCLCVDEKGNVVSGDAILYVYGRYMKERGKLLTNTVVTTVMSNFGLYKAFDALDIDYAKTAVGDKYVYEYMMQNGCRIGGEQSGHIIFSKYASTGDGILTSLKMMEVILARKKKLSELTADLAIYPQVLENVRVHDKAAAQADVDVQAAVESVAEALGDTGRILVRESGTEPLLRVMVEAESEELCRKYVDQVVEIVRKKGHVAE